MAKKRDDNRPIIISVIAVILIAALVWYFWSNDKENEPGTTADKPADTGQTGDTGDKGGNTGDTGGDTGNTGEKPINGFIPGDEGDTTDGSSEESSSNPPPVKVPKNPTMSESEARDMYKQGMAMLEAGKTIEARTELSAAYFSDALDEETQDNLRKTLTDLANDTLFSRRIYDDDPYVYKYIFKQGDVLARVIGPKGEALRVPDQMIMQINGIDAATASSLRPGKELKFIRGPFHAVIYKNNFTMDIYLQHDDLPKTFVRRLRVGLGKNGGTPEGMWHVKLGGKMPRAEWTPVAGMGGPRHVIRWEDDDPEYPLGKKGYWISLEGLDENTRQLGGYGIHGTNDPDSIGKSYSLGCIRLLDDDIEFVFFTLYEHHSTVEIKP